ncbi:MAG: TIGR03986 family CRISPR-associated RAMP protein [Nostoc sp.]|uniref:TIGR03986 family type III CRISPR-associated RAMP protein n=1 Tax=Nostoc sp. TaxID=1180 RepID=UPI002FF7B1B3
MNPRHIAKIKDDRKAIAPYNFVELPEKVVEVSPESLPKENRYYLQSEKRYTGRIECSLTTESPLYIRCGLTREEFECGAETKDLPDFFYTNHLEKSTKPVIPGSSLRGMIRNLVEIVSFSKIEQVSDNKRLFFRAVAANPKQDSLGEAYKQYVLPKNIEAGYLKQDSEGWYIKPAKVIRDKTFAWVRENDINFNHLKRFNDDEYHPQYVSVSYEMVDVEINDRAKRLFAWNIDLPNIYQNKGILVTSGNMKQGNESSPRRNHCIVFEENSTAFRLRLDNKVIDHYCNALTDFQKKPPFDKRWGMLNENCSVVFYYPPQNGNKVGFFGQSPNFRIPYSLEGDGQATTVVDFIPTALRNSLQLDLADAIFGWVKKDEKDEDKNLPKDMRQRGSRVFITDAQYKSNERGIWYKGNFNDTVIPQILSEPKPTTFQHYLVQPEKDNPQADKSKIKHYANQPESETVIRGHKLYWHKGRNPNIQNPNRDIQDSQTTQIKPINQGVNFEFKIYFENLSDIELGALLWILDIAQIQDKQYRLKLGMGKPLGMGAIKIEPQLYLSDRTSRYSKLFEKNRWAIEETQVVNEYYNTAFVEPFQKHILDNISIEDYPQGKNRGEIDSISHLPRIEMLLAMLTWDKPLNIDKETRYMEIERDVNKFNIGKPKPKDKTVNEYQERPILPTPLQGMGWVDNRRMNNPPPLPLNSANLINTTKPKLKGSDRPKPIKKDKQNQQLQKPKDDSEGGNFNVFARPKKPKF